jgi:uncharacterized protein YjgD (DUF1641 family)
LVEKNEVKLLYTIGNLKKDSFLKQIELVENQLKIINNKILDKFIQQKEEIKNLINKLDVITKKPSIKENKEFITAYNDVYNQLEEKLISFKEIKKSLIIQREKYLLKENITNNLIKVINNMFSLLKNSLITAINKGNSLKN